MSLKQLSALVHVTWGPSITDCTYVLRTYLFIKCAHVFRYSYQIIIHETRSVPIVLAVVLLSQIRHASITF